MDVEPAHNVRDPVKASEAMAVRQVELNDRTAKRARSLPVWPPGLGEEQGRGEIWIAKLHSYKLLDGALRAADLATP